MMSVFNDIVIALLHSVHGLADTPSCGVVSCDRWQAWEIAARMAKI